MQGQVKSNENNALKQLFSVISIEVGVLLSSFFFLFFFPYVEKKKKKAIRPWQDIFLSHLGSFKNLIRHLSAS